MTELTLPRPGVLRPAGGGPRLVVAGQVSRRAARSGALWGLVFALFIVVQTVTYTSEYDTQAARDQMARVYGTNAGMNAIFGQADAINTIDGWVTWRFVGIVGLLGSAWGVLTATRLLRGDEESGRYELLLAGQTTRRRAGGQAIAGLGVGLAAMFVLTALGTIAVGRRSTVDFGLGQCLYLSVTLVAGAAMFLAVGALACQLMATRRSAAAMAGGVLGVAYALRMVADSNPSVHWLVWLSPLGWLEQVRPLTEPNPTALLPALVLLVGAAALALHLVGVRDVGTAALPDRHSARPRLALLGGPTRFAARLQRPVALGWLPVITAFSVLLGAVAESSTEDATGSKDVEQAIGRLGGHGSSAALYLGLTFLVVALLVALVAAGQSTAIRAEEAEGHLDNLLVRPVRRASWLAGRLGLSCLLLVAAGLLAGVGAWVGTAGQDDTVRPGALVTAGLNVVPPGLLLLGLGTLAFGAWPRRTSMVVYAYLTWSVLVEFAGGTVHLSHWLLDTSVFFHMAPAPAGGPDWSSAAVITGLGVVGALLGGLLFSRRDLKDE